MPTAHYTNIEVEKPPQRLENSKQHISRITRLKFHWTGYVHIYIMNG